MCSFRNEHCSSKSKFLKLVWEIKEKTIQYNFKIIFLHKKLSLQVQMIKMKVLHIRKRGIVLYKCISFDLFKVIAEITCTDIILPLGKSQILLSIIIVKNSFLKILYQVEKAIESSRVAVKCKFLRDHLTRLFFLTFFAIQTCR